MRSSGSPASRVARRRRRGVALLAGGALVLGVVAGASGGGGGGPAPTAPGSAAPPSALDQARRAVVRMPLERQVGELLVISFSGGSAPPYVLRALREGRAAGVILFGGNARSAASVRALTAALQRAAGGDAIVCLDQEGGAIRTLAFAPSAVGQAGQRTPVAARTAAARTARALHAGGVNVVLGPVADVAQGTPGSVMATRAYPGDAAAVAASVQAAVIAYAHADVQPTLKHFPGLGAATTNTDAKRAVIRRSPAQLAADLQPFATPAPLVMVGHARYPALDPAHIASQSHTIATGLLRTELGFTGVAISDSLEAHAALATTGGNVGTAAVRSLAAGIDLLLTTGPGSFLPVRKALLAAAHRSSTLRARIAESAARVLALRATLRVSG